MTDKRPVETENTFQVPYTTYTESELPVEVQELFSKAREATTLSYVPYSSFRVGCALGLSNGEIITGSNQENASFPAGICAERVGLVKASTGFPDVVMERIAIVALPDKSDRPVPVTPCGICRQSLLEYEVRQGRPLQVWFYTSNDKYICIPSASLLLPFSFTKDDLKSVG